MKDGIHIKQANNNAGSGKPGKKKKKAGVYAGIIIGAIVVILAVGSVAAGLYVNNLDTIYPNVSVGGIDLSGKTLDEAKKALVDGGFEKEASNIVVNVNFPDGEKLIVTGGDSGLTLQAEQAAKIAYAYGRDGSVLDKGLKFANSLFSTHDVDTTGATSINEAYVKSVVDEGVKKFNEKLMKGAYTITDSYIEIVKGSTTTLADTDTLYKLVITALGQSVTQNKPMTIDYTIGTNGGDGIDLKAIYSTLHTDPVDAVFDKATFKPTQSTAGVSFDLDAAQKMLDASKTGAKITIPLVHTDPKVSTEQLQSMIFRDVLSEKTTHVSGTANRLHNVALAASTINGTILNPGDTFSYNGTLGQRTTEKGYLEAGAYVDGEVKQETGGGICQMSSTLYYTVLYANLEVVDRSNHMFVVAYLPLGDDATVSWESPDFKFKNNTDYPIQIESFYKSNSLTVRLHGTKTDTNTYDVKYVLISTTEFKTVQKEDPTIEAGKTKVSQAGVNGYVVETYKYIYDGAGNLLSKTYIDKSSYRPENRIILVPVGTLTSPSPTDTSGVSPSGSTPSPSDTAPSPSDVTPSDSVPSPSDTAASPSDTVTSPSPSASPAP